ncbi:MAG: hypothetical protein JWP12_1160 [Bacteroidetes bacterium]|nr:hypothetical protein [Bacteroidota bacterium]
MITTDKYSVTMLTETIFRLKVAEGTELELEDVQEVRSAFMHYSKGKKFMVLFDANNLFSITPEARVLIASEEYTRDRVATAFVTDQLSGKLLCNFFIKYNRPATPTKVFTDESSAYSWLLAQMEKAQEADAQVAKIDS